MKFTKKNRKALYQDEEWLTKEYVEENRTIKDIAKECKVAKGTVQDWINKYKLSKKEDDKKYDYRKRDWLYVEYIIKNKTQQTIADEQGVGKLTIERWLRKFNIYKRNW